MVAVVGSRRLDNYMWLRAMSAFKGKVFSVQIDENELPGIADLGFENYRSLTEIPGPVDYVVVAVPRNVAPHILADCIRNGVGGATFFTSGFAETGTEEGRSLQDALTRMAKEAGFKLIGPNCMGIFNPRLGVLNSADLYYGESGPVGFISQSGTHSIFFSHVAGVNGVKISKSVSYGNAIVLDSPDYLDYLSQDEETKYIGLYIEGVKDGRRFFEVLRRTTPRKPVVIWKGGQTEAGTRATASHTGVLAESQVVWEALIRQCGAVPVHSLDDMVDVMKAFVLARPTIGGRAGLMAMTGGQSVVITDSFAKAGLEVPLLTQKSYDELASFFNIIGGSYRNPFDMGSTVLGGSNLDRLLDIMGDDENVDTVVMELSVAFMSRRWGVSPEVLQALLQSLADFRARTQKPFLVVTTAAQMEAEALQARDRLTEYGLPAFPTFERAARALRRTVDYYRFQAETNGQGR